MERFYSEFETMDPVVTRPGGAGNRKVVTQTFAQGVGHWKGARTRALVAVDLDAASFESLKPLRRRAARAAVPVGKRSASWFATGADAPAISRREGATSWWATAVFHRTEVFEGFERRAQVSIDLRINEDDEDCAIASIAAQQASKALSQLVEDIHVAVSGSKHQHLFGPN